MEIRQHDDRQHARNGVRGDVAVGTEALEGSREPRRHHMLAVHAQAETGQRDAHLRGGDELILAARIAQDCHHRTGSRVSCSRTPLERHAWRRHDRKLGRDEQAVEHDQRADDDDRQEVIHDRFPVLRSASR
jgi:hypothetical protein